MENDTPFLNTPYGGYLHSQVPPEDEDLTHVGPGTPCGEWFRRFWQPVAVSEELKDLPKAIRILNEELVIFRDRSGQVGLLELHCSHRGTSLEFGQIEERGIRCCYHAWCYDVDGKILDTPGEPADSTLRERLYHGAYPTLEYKGLVFAYMGPPEKRPVFPIYDTFDLPEYQQLTAPPQIRPANWLQIRENVMDPVHLRFLHQIEGNVGFSEDFEEEGELDFMETPAGMVCIDSRRLGDQVWVSIGDFIPPTIHQGTDLAMPCEGRDLIRPTLTLWTVPVDDANTLRLGFLRIPKGQTPRRSGPGFGQSVDRSYEERQRVPGDYDAQVSQRSIAVHDMEHLASTDRGVIMLRNIVRRGIRAVQRGEDPEGVTFQDNGVVPTYSHDRVVTVPRAPTYEEDREQLRQTGRRVVGQSVMHPLVQTAKLP